MHAGQLDDDLVGILLADLRLRDAELVDAIAHDRHRTVEILGSERVPLRRDCLEDDLEAALDVEALGHVAVTGHAGNSQEGDPEQGCQDDPDQR